MQLSNFVQTVAMSDGASGLMQFAASYETADAFVLWERRGAAAPTPLATHTSLVLAQKEAQNRSGRERVLAWEEVPRWDGVPGCHGRHFNAYQTALADASSSEDTRVAALIHVQQCVVCDALRIQADDRSLEG